MRNRLRVLLAAFLLALTAVTMTPSPADAATVPNRFYCSHSTKRCYQVNGSFVGGLPCAIHMKHMTINTSLTERGVHDRCNRAGGYVYYVW